MNFNETAAAQKLLSSFYIVGEALRTNEIFVDSVASWLYFHHEI